MFVGREWKPLAERSLNTVQATNRTSIGLVNSAVSIQAAKIAIWASSTVYDLRKKTLVAQPDYQTAKPGSLGHISGSPETLI